MNHVDFVDVGHGCCTVFRSTDEVFIFDAGNKGAVLEYTLKAGISKIDRVVITHADQDHISGLLALLTAKTVEIGEVLLNGDPKGTKIWEDVRAELDDQDKTGRIKLTIGVLEGYSFTSHDGRFIFAAVGPTKAMALASPSGSLPTGERVTSNSMSAVFVVSFDKQPLCLITGDLDLVGLKSIIGKGTKLQAPILQFPHHGGLPGSGAVQEFVDMLIGAVKPERIVFSFGRDKFKNPAPRILKRIRAVCSAKIVCTQLSKHCSEKLSDSESHLLSATYSAGAEKKSCCAGTVRTLPSSGTYSLPMESDHETFVDEHVDSPMCRSR